MEIILPSPHKTQEPVLLSNSRFITLMCGRRWGKSLISQVKATENALGGKKVAYVTPTFLLAKVFFQEIASLLPKNTYTTNNSDLIINLITGGSIRFFTGTRLDSFRGLKFHLVIIDEASYIPDLEKGWLNSIRPTLTDYKGNAIFLSTPKGQNYFYSLFLKGGTGDWESFKYSTYDNPFIDKSEIDDAKTQLPELVFEQEYMANPSENQANPFGLEHINKCVRVISSKPPVCIGIDLAKSYDYTAIIGLDADGNVCLFDRFQMDWHSTKEAIKRLPRVQMRIDSSGVGDPIVEDLIREGLPVHAFKFTAQSKQNLMQGLAMAIQKQKIGFPSGVIKDELSIFEFQFSGSGVKYSAPSGFHDDCVMSLGLAWEEFSLGRGTGRYSFK